jgi:hypothetical protein
MVIDGFRIWTQWRLRRVVAKEGQHHNLMVRGLTVKDVVKTTTGCCEGGATPNKYQKREEQKTPT